MIETRWAFEMVISPNSELDGLEGLLMQALTRADALELGLVAVKISEALDQLRLFTDRDASRDD